MKININGITRDMTEEEIKSLELSAIPEQQIEALKQQLNDTDYQAIKYAEGWLTEEDYAPIKEQRQIWRNEINKLQTKTMK